jgi:uncharacterized protein
VNTASTTLPERATAQRLAGPDVVRAVALIGVVVMNYHGYLLLADARGPGRAGSGWAVELFDPWTGPLSTRFAATFVLVAGVGVSLMTASSIGTPRVTAMRWRLVRRGTLLYVSGLLLDVIWPGTILPFYGAMFVLAAAMFTWRARWIVVTGAAAAVAGWAIRMWRYDRDLAGLNTGWLTDPAAGTPADHLFGVTVNGTHPLLPWLAFFCAGMLLGRYLRTSWWRPVALGSGVALFSLAGLVSIGAATDYERVLLSTLPLERGLLYTVSALGTSLIAYAVIDWLAVRFPVATDPLRRAGQMTLTLYVAHVFVFKLLVDWFDVIDPAGVGTAVSFALAFWVVGIIAAVAWQRRFGIGPLERVYRVVGG